MIYAMPLLYSVVTVHTPANREGFVRFLHKIPRITSAKMCLKTHFVCIHAHVHGVTVYWLAREL
jgi:hypothetical protein